MGGQQLPINLSGVIVALILLLAALLDQAPLESQRPPKADIKPEPSGPFETIPARVWEDPLEAIKRAAPAADTAPTPADTGIVGDYLQHLATTAKRTRLVLMPVLVSGAPHPAVREARLRMRVAVHAGLLAAGFLPARSDRIGLWSWQAAPGLALDVPFEAFVWQGGDERRIVLLLWVNDDVLSRDLGSESATAGGMGSASSGPLAMLDRLLAAIGYPEQVTGCGGGSADRGRACAGTYPGFRSSAVRVIGPASSDSMEALSVELLGWSRGGGCVGAYRHVDNEPDGEARPPAAGRGPWDNDPVNFEVVSPLATAPWWQLVGAGLDPARIPEGQRVVVSRGEERCATVAVLRTVVSDDVLIRALIDELRLRGIDPTARRGHTGTLPLPGLAVAPFDRPNTGGSDWGSRDHIVLVAEWDTKFGRTLSELFEREVVRRWCPAVVEQACGERPDSDRAACRAETAPRCRAPWIHRFAYLRGLDGDAPPVATGGGKSDRVDLLALAAGTEAGFKEPASGTNQFDYLRRLTQQVAELDWLLKREGRGSIKAFGILGNDYFDKLLILQALKERFPSHLFFTTDLDAGLLDARVFRWTRNLVIAAPFGLTLRRSFDPGDGADLQGMVPPFRHSYQTALFLTVQRTLAGQEGALVPPQTLDPEAPGPLAPGWAHLFEVGNGRFFALSPPTPPPPRPIRTADVVGAIRPATPGTESAGDRHPAPWRSGMSEFMGAHAAQLVLLLVLGAVAVLAVLPGPRRRLRRSLLRQAGGGRVGGRVGSGHGLGQGLARGLGHVRGLLEAGRRRVAPVVRRWSCTPGCAALLVTLLYLAVAVFWVWPLARGAEPFSWLGGVSIWPSEIVRLVAGWVAWMCLIYGWQQVYRADRRIEAAFALGGADAGCPVHRFADWRAGDDGTAASGAAAGSGPEPVVARVHRMLGIVGPPRAPAPAVPVVDARREWACYRRFAAPAARGIRVGIAALAFLLFAFVLVYGFVDPLSPHRGEAAYRFSFINGWLLVGLPFFILLFAAVDEALLTSGLLRRLAGRRIAWPSQADGGGLEADSRRAVSHWITTELVAQRTGAAASVIHLPFIVILPLLLSLSSRFDNWNTPVSVIGLLALAIAIGFWASLLLRGTARRIRGEVLDDLREDVSGIEYAAAETRSERLRNLVARIEAVHDGAYTNWYNEPIFRALLWVLAIGVLIITEYATIGG